MAKNFVALLEREEVEQAPQIPERERLRQRAAETLEGRDLEQYMLYLDSPIDPRD